MTDFRVGLAALAVAVTAMLAPTALASDDHDGDHELVQYLTRTGVDADGIAKVEWEDEGDEVEFEIKLSLMDPGTYELKVGGVMRGSIVVGLDGKGELEFENEDEGEGEGDSDDNELLLDFDPIGQLIEIQQGVETFFSDVFAPDGAGSHEDEEIEIEVYLVNVATDLDFDANGRLKYEQEDGGTRTKFEVKTKDLDAGLYDLSVASVVVASFDATGYEEVKVKFDGDPSPGDSDDDDDGDEDELELQLVLDFDPLGELVKVSRQGTGEVILSATLPASAGTSGVNTHGHGHKWAKDLGKKHADKLRVKLHNSGHMPGAKGKAELEIEAGERDLEVEIENVGDGSFDVCLGGVLVGAIVTSGGEGELKLSTDPEGGEVLLEVPVRGALLEIKAAGIVVLSSLMPVSVPDAVGKYKVEKRKYFNGTTDLKRLKLNLLNAVEDLDTLGRLTWKQKTDGVRLVVKFKDLPDGTYGLWLDGFQVAEAEVQNGKAKLSFNEALESPQGSQLPMDFDVLGGHLEVRNQEGDVMLRADVD